MIDDLKDLMYFAYHFILLIVSLVLLGVYTVGLVLLITSPIWATLILIVWAIHAIII